MRSRSPAAGERRRASCDFSRCRRRPSQRTSERSAWLQLLALARRDEPRTRLGGHPALRAALDSHDGLTGDWIACSPVRYRDEPGGVVGMKPEAFCVWLFRALGARPGDELVDLFPGSGAVSRAWERFAARPPLRFAGPLRNEPLDGLA